MVGKTLAHYQVLEKLGAGGMGEVYRARDTKLGRDVALKILPPEFARDAERMARFEREAQVLAALNHPNIAAIYGLEQAGDTPYLVLEYVPGETLRGPLAVEEALGLARQMAAALEAAHDKAIMHRDLKPANVKVTPEGKLKVLDFGLAKAFAGEAPAGDLSRSPTLSADPTRAGTILGTPAYMSPEQARGRKLDKRTDIWAFGCVLYELLAGRQAFGGESISDTMAAVLGRDPDWEALPVETPPHIRSLLRRCLERDLQKRLHDIADARIELEDAPVAQASRPVQPGFSPALAVLAAALLLALVALAVTLWSVWRRPVAAPPPVTRMVVALPATDRLSSDLQPSLAISQDGSSTFSFQFRIT